MNSKPSHPDRLSLARRFNQLRIDHLRISEIEAEIFELQQLKHKLDYAYHLKKSRYESDQRTWFVSTHETVIQPSLKPSSSFEDILAELLQEALEEKGAEL